MSRFAALAAGDEDLADGDTLPEALLVPIGLAKRVRLIIPVRSSILQRGFGLLTNRLVKWRTGLSQSLSDHRCTLSPSWSYRGSAKMVSSGFSRTPDKIKVAVQATNEKFVFGTRKNFTSRKEFESFVSTLGLNYDASLESYFGTPSETLGQWSKWNIQGRLVTRKDLPKEERDLGGWNYPYFGDPSKGYGIAHRVAKCYPRETWYGEQLQASVRVLEENGNISAICAVEKSLPPSVDPDSRSVLYAASLARHWFGKAEVLELDKTGTVKLPTEALDWEVFPPGTAEDDKEFLSSKLTHRASPTVVSEAVSRMVEVKKLGPKEMLIGNSGLESYLGFKFDDDLVVFENIRHGNALYILKENWKDLSRLSRTELLKSHRSEIIRIIHNKGWEKRLRHEINLRKA